MIRKAWLLLPPLVAGLLWIGAPSAEASDASWTVTGVNSTGCSAIGWSLTTHLAGLDTDPYVLHSQVASGGKVYMSYGFSALRSNGDLSWSLFGDFSYGAVSNPSSWPIPAGQQITVRLTVERPKGTILAGSTMVLPNCDSTQPTLNAADKDGDLVIDSHDACAGLAAATSNGCPLRNRTLTLRRRTGPSVLSAGCTPPGLRPCTRERP